MKIVGDEFSEARIAGRIRTKPLNQIFGRSWSNDLFNFDRVPNKVLPGIRLSLTKDRNVREIQIERAWSTSATEPNQWRLGFDERFHCGNCGGASSDHCHAMMWNRIKRHNHTPSWIVGRRNGGRYCRLGCATNSQSCTCRSDAWVRYIPKVQWQNCAVP